MDISYSKYMNEIIFKKIEMIEKRQIVEDLYNEDIGYMTDKEINELFIKEENKENIFLNELNIIKK